MSCAVDQKSVDTLISVRRRVTITQLQKRFRNTRKCVSSEASLLVLLWSFLVSLVFFFLYYLKILVPANDLKYSSIFFSCFSAMLFFFYPIGGHLADTKFGRYRVVVTSLWIVVLAAVLEVVAVGFLGLVVPGIVAIPTHRVNTAVIGIGGTAGITGLGLLMFGISGFFANVIQFGLDQLHDSPAEDQSLFIHWYMWSYYVAQLIMRIVLSSFSQSVHTYDLGYATLELILVSAALTLLTSLCISRCNKHWFLIQPSRVNPYRLVYLVTKFSRKHKVPVNRSAFTYCEDEIPSGLDLGKAKYGGPFTTEQVEDVKAFYGILKVLISLGPMFFIDRIRDMTKPPLPSHIVHVTQDRFIQPYPIVVGGFDYMKFVEEFLIHDSVLYYLTASICIPLYLFAIRPLIQDYIPGMLKRIGTGQLIIVISLLLAAILNSLHPQLHCFSRNYHGLKNITDSSSPSMIQHNLYSLVLPEAVAAISHMTFYVALYEFICSQSPSSMKGLLIGLTYSIRGLFEFLALMLQLLLHIHADHPSGNCRIKFYLANIGVGVVSLLVYARIAKKYKFRVRDEVCNVYRFVEEYYSKTEEP